MKETEKFLEQNGAHLQTGTWVNPDHGQTLFSVWADHW